MQAARYAGHRGVDRECAIARPDRRTRRCPGQDVEMPHRASSQVQDAAAASASSVPHNSHQQGAPMSVANSINWFELYVQDMPRARAFYEALLGITLEPLKLPEGGDEGLEMWSFPGDMERYGANGALCRMPGVPSGPGGTLVYFACEDCGITAGRVAAAGGRVHREKMSIGEYGFIALAFDTEGNMIGLHSMR
jgi:predicted enzyme related to lactoylglutathione lyase